MPRPSKSYTLKNIISGKETEPCSAHGVTKVTVIDEETKTTRRGYFKPCGLTKYPPILAKYVVAFSIFVRAALGQRASEDCLVYDEKGNIAGTVSFEVPDFVHLLAKLDPDYKNDGDQKLGCPDKATLLAKNVAEFLVSACRHQNNDLHPANFSVNGLIDWDELYYKITSIIKYDINWFFNSPKTISDPTETDIRILPRAENPKHWPTHFLPLNWNIFKIYRTTAFTELEGDTLFEKQKFTAILKELLAYDKDMIKKRLLHYLGDTPLNLNELSESKKQKLKKYDEHIIREHKRAEPDVPFSGLFYDGDKKENSFAEHCSKFFEDEHNKFKNTVIKMDEFRKHLIYLNKHPDELVDIIKWFKKENKDNPVPYDLINIKQLYYSLWKESVKSIHNNYLSALKDRYADFEKINQSTGFGLVSLEKKQDLNESLILVNRTADDIIKKIKDQTMALHDKLKKEMESYYAKTTLTIKDNHDFIDACEAIIRNAKKERDQKWLEDEKDRYKENDTAIDTLLTEIEVLYLSIDICTKEFLDKLHDFRIIENTAFKEIPNTHPEIQELKSTRAMQQLTLPAVTSANSNTYGLPTPESAMSDINEEEYDFLKEDQMESKIATSEKALIESLIKKLPHWVEKTSPAIIKGIVQNTRLTEYNGKGYFRGLFYSRFRTRGPEVDDMSLSKIFSTHDWTSTSLNTLIVKNCCLAMVSSQSDDTFGEALVLKTMQVRLNDQNNYWWETYAENIAIQSGLKAEPGAKSVAMAGK